MQTTSKGGIEMDCACRAKGIKEKVMEITAKGLAKSTGAMAVDLGVSEMEVIRNLPADMVKEVSKERFDEIIEDISQWGTLMVIVSNGSIILEIKAPFPVGTYGHGYYNLESSNTPIGGHIRADDLSAIFFVSRPYMDMETHSIQFFNKNGNAMFKLFLGWDENRQIISEQMGKFINLKNRLCQRGERQCGQNCK